MQKPVPSYPTRLKVERDRLRINQHATARMVGMTQVEISRIEQGRLTPTPDELERLGRLFDVHPPEKLLKPVVLVEEVAR